MRFTFRLLSGVKPGRCLEAYAPTGLTGLVTHPTPRPTLIFLYSSILEKLKALPQSSVYRQSTEALTRQRLKIVEQVKPEGYDAWLEKVREKITANPDAYKEARRPDGSYALSGNSEEKDEEWDGEKGGPQLEGTYTEGEKGDLGDKILADAQEYVKTVISWDVEPALASNQISDIENQIGAGLIEEVIQVAEGELKLVDEMARAKVWEELVEKPAPGQWTYFERGTHTGET